MVTQVESLQLVLLHWRTQRLPWLLWRTRGYYGYNGGLRAGTMVALDETIVTMVTEEDLLQLLW